MPPLVDRAKFDELCLKHGPGKCADSVFGNLCSDAGTLTREKVMEMSRYTDVYLSHERGIDVHGRYTHDRIKKLAKFLRDSGFLVWLDEEQASKFGCVFNPKERARQGIENTQVVLVFLTKRYSDLLERFLHAHTNINLNAASGVASSDSGEQCGFEFEHGMGFKGNKHLRAVVPCVMEKRMMEKSNWGPRLLETLGQRFIVDLSDFESNPEVLPDLRNFLFSAVGSPLLQGGPFLKNKNAELTSTKGRHFHWLREQCNFTHIKASKYAEALVAHGIMSTTRLFFHLEKNSRYLIDDMRLDDANDAATIARAIRSDVRSNIDPVNQNSIDKVIEEKNSSKQLAVDFENQKVESEKAWVKQVYEDEEMCREDHQSRRYMFNVYMHEVETTSKATASVRLEEAVQFDMALREGEKMLRQDILSGSVRHVELQRRRDMIDMCTLTSPSLAAAHIRRIAGNLHAALRRSVPSKFGDTGQYEPPVAADKPPVLVDQPSDTNWHRLLEEVACALVMTKRVCQDDPDAQRQMTDKGVLKVILLLLLPPCTNTVNIFTVPDAKTIHHAATYSDPALFERLQRIVPINVSVATAGIDALRYLCRCKDDSTDMSGNNDRNVFLLGQAGTIDLILGIIKQHLRSIKRGALFKQRMLALGNVGSNARRRVIPAKHQTSSSHNAFRAISDAESIERSTHAVFAALECIFSMAGRTIDHPNKLRFEQARAFEVLLMCSHSLKDSPIVFRWAGKLIVLLFSEKTDPGVHGRLCNMVTGCLRRFVAVPGSCSGGCIAVSHLSYISALVELLAPVLARKAHRDAAATTARMKVRSGPAPADNIKSFFAAVQNSLSYWLRERGAAELCLECIARHYQHESEGAKVVACAARALGNLCFRNIHNKELFLHPSNVQILIDAATFHHDKASVMAEILFALGNLVDISGAQEHQERLSDDDGCGLNSTTTPPTPFKSSSACTLSDGNVAATLFVSRGAVEIVQTAMVEHRDNADCCYMAMHAFGKLLFGTLHARNLPLLNRIICIGTCDQVCKAMLNHPQRLDLFILGCQALQLVATSQYDDVTQGTQRIIKASCCEAVNLGMRTATFALVELFSRPSVVQSPDITMQEEDGGRHDPLLFSGTAFFSGCLTIQLMLRSIRPAEFLAALKRHGLLQTFTAAPVARIRAMLLQIKQCCDLGQVGGSIVLGQALMFVQAACDLDHLSPEQRAEEASNNNPSLYPRRIEFFPLVSAERYEECLRGLFDILGLDYQNWVESKS